MANFVLRWALNIVALFLVINIVAGVSIDSWQAIVVAGFVLGLLNAFLKPALMLLTLPFNVLSLGLLTLFINGGIFYLAAKFVKGFHVMSFWDAFWAAFAFSAISFVLNMFFAPAMTIRARSFREGPPPRGQKRYDNVIDVEGKIEDEKEDK